MRLGSKRYISVRPLGRKITFWITVLLISILLICMIAYVFCVMRPAFASLAENSAKEIAVKTINEVISQKFSEENNHRDIVELERTDEGRITAVKSNLVGISKLKSDLNLDIQKRISTIDKSSLKIPLGSLTGNDFFVGMGPDIPFKIKPFGTVITDVKTNFSQAGINQTKCDIIISVKVNISILSPMIRKSSIVETTIPVIETVVVGEVPENYVNVDRDGYEFEDDVLQLAE